MTEKYLELILNLPVGGTFTYSWRGGDGAAAPVPGMRAEIMFGNRRTTGFITAVHDGIPPDCPVDASRIRPVRRILDEEPLLDGAMMDMALWLSRYYLCTPGEAVFAMTPSGRRERSAGGLPSEPDIAEKGKNVLSAEQSAAVDGVMSAGKELFHYVYGPTGSGKTEVFLSLAEKVLESGRGVIYLVPEISLTRQVAQAIAGRFGDTAAVLHSGLTQSQKLSEWRRIMRGAARVVVGARSGVFAPVPDLGLIIIDEEHDGSYKSGTAPRYHARQVAMHRCSCLGIPLVMGSATPSVEAWQMMECGRIRRHTLSSRLSGGSMPETRCIDLNRYPADGCISEPLERMIRSALDSGHQAILFLNRRGFTHFFRCNSCGYELTCRNCSVPLTYHRSDNRLRCHYCGWSADPPQSCPSCGSLDIGSAGFGTEFIEAETRAKFPNARIVRADTDSFRNRDELLDALDSFKRGEYDIMLGTQMVAKGLNFPRLQLAGIILADTGLHIPDFRAGERTFSLITQVAGRAGRYIPDGKVAVQTYSPGREPVMYACAGKTAEFYRYELEQRRMLGFPPFSRLVRLVFRSADRNAAAETAAQAVPILRKEAARGAEIIGPAECAVFRISGNYRYHILLKGESVIPLQAAARALLFRYSHSRNVYIECDVDPVSLL